MEPRAAGARGIVVRLPPYSRYKPSGVEWFGEVPAHWEVMRLKGAATYWVSNVDKVAADDEMPVRLCNYTDVYYNDHIKSSMPLMESTATPEEIRRFSLLLGDVVITKDSEEWSDIAVPALVVESTPDLVCGYHLAIVRPRASVLEGAFLLRAFQACAVNQQFQIAATGVTRYGLPKSSIGETWIPFPSLPEQRAIAEFLDHETGMINTLVAKKRTLIERLKEKRSALISHTVTHGLPPDAARATGLDPHPKLKPSGIEWIREVPEHWDVVRIGRRMVLQRGIDITKDEQSDGPVPVVSSGGISSYHDRAIAQGPGVVVGRKGTAGAVYFIPVDFWPHDTTLWVREFLGSHPRFVYFKLLTMDLSSFDTGSANPTVNRNLVHPVIVSWPPPQEQRMIADFLDRETTRIDRMVAKVDTAIERLQEYRTALITAAVTGQIDVGSAAA
jgi:type I restriction enzyme S subunit